MLALSLAFESFTSLWARYRIIVLPLSVIALTACASNPPNLEEAAKELYSRETLISVAERDMQNGNREQALGIYQELISRNDKDKPALAAAAVVSRELQEYELSAAYYKRLLALAPEDETVREQLAEVNIQSRHYDEAESDLKMLTLSSPKNWRAWNGLGLIADLRGNYAKSEKFYAKALDANPSSAEIRNNRGYSLIMSHRYAEAEQVLREGLHYDPDNSRLHNNLLLALAWQGRYDEAVNVARVSLEEWIAYNNVGYIAQLKGDYDSAVRMYNAALSSSPRFYPTAASNLDNVLSLVEQRKKAARSTRAIR